MLRTFVESCMMWQLWVPTGVIPCTSNIDTHCISSAPAASSRALTFTSSTSSTKAHCRLDETLSWRHHASALREAIWSLPTWQLPIIVQLIVDRPLFDMMIVPFCTLNVNAEMPGKLVTEAQEITTEFHPVKSAMKTKKNNSKSVTGMPLTWDLFQLL